MMGSDSTMVRKLWVDWDTMLTAPQDEVRITKTYEVASLIGEMLKQGQKTSQIMNPRMKYSHLATKDSLIQVFTWSVPLTDGSYSFGGVLLSNQKNIRQTYVLRNAKKDLPHAEMDQNSSSQWFGAVYYQLIEYKHKGNTYYILLGWDGGKYPVARKLIEVLTFNGEGEPKWGAPIFAGNKIFRKIFEYQQNTYFPLKYEKQTVYRKVWYKRKPIPRKENMIVFNRLGREPGFAAPLPVVNVVDAYIWRDGKLILLKDIDARNPEGKYDRTPAPLPAQGLY